LEGVTRESLRPLLDLQRVDSSIDKLNQRKADLPEQRELDDLVARRTETGGAHANKRAELDTVAREQSKIEDDVSLVSNKIDHEQGRLYSGEIQNAKELSNIQAELDALRRRKTHLEDQELEVMERREVLEGETGALATDLASLDAEIVAATARRDAALAEIERELGALGAQRAGLVPLLPEDVVEMYDGLRGKFGGIAVGALDKGTCKACGLPLSPVARDEFARSEDPIFRCENCRRILIPA
jgi:predicted  nucleic acid-binding Zn-ribbon protein